MPCECKNTTYTKLSKQDILDMIADSKDNAECCKKATSMIEELSLKLEELDKSTIVDIALVDDKWVLVAKDGNKKPFRKADKDTQNNILEEED